MNSRIGPSLLTLMLIVVAGVPGFTDCAPSIPLDQFDYRFGVMDSIRSDADYLALLDNPTVVTATAVPAPPGDPAATIAVTETQALYPVPARFFVEVLKDETVLPSIIPDLAVHRTICNSGSGWIKQFQRTEFNVLFLTFGTEYRIDVHYVLNGPEEYGSYWGMYESVDNKLTRQFGSWYFRNIEIDGRTYVYVRHYMINGIRARIPGLRIIFQRSAANQVKEMIEAVYEEAARRYAVNAVAASESPSLQRTNTP